MQEIRLPHNPELPQSELPEVGNLVRNTKFGFIGRAKEILKDGEKTILVYKDSNQNEFADIIENFEKLED